MQICMHGYASPSWHHTTPCMVHVWMQHPVLSSSCCPSYTVQYSTDAGTETMSRSVGTAGSKAACHQNAADGSAVPAITGSGRRMYGRPPGPHQVYLYLSPWWQPLAGPPGARWLILETNCFSPTPSRYR